MVVEAFVAVLDNLIELAKYKKRKKKELFSEIVEPLFEETQPIVDEYFWFFREARTLVVSATETQYPEVIRQLKKSRKDFLTARVKISEMAKVIRDQTRISPLQEFAASIEHFFDTSIIDKPSYHHMMTKRAGVISRVEKVAEKPLPNKNGDTQHFLTRH